MYCRYLGGQVPARGPEDGTVLAACRRATKRRGWFGPRVELIRAGVLDRERGLRAEACGVLGRLNSIPG